MNVTTKLILFLVTGTKLADEITTYIVLKLPPKIIRLGVREIPYERSALMRWLLSHIGSWAHLITFSIAIISFMGLNYIRLVAINNKLKIAEIVINASIGFSLFLILYAIVNNLSLILNW